MPQDIQITFDCADPSALADFWCQALGFHKEAPPKGFDTWDDALRAWGVPEDQWNSRSAIVDPEGARPRVFFQQVPEGKSVKNRLHLDIRTAPGLKGDERMAALEAEAGRLEGLGASRFARLEATGIDAGIIVMLDPEGNEFCLD